MVGDKGTIQEDRVAPMIALMVAPLVEEEGLATTQVHHLVEAKVVPALWIVPPWSRDSPTWRGRRPCWRRREGPPAPPRR